MNNMTHPGRSAAEQDSLTPVAWTPTREKPLPTVRCTVIKRDGDRCGRWALRGATVCVSHGGRLPNIQKHAEAVIESARMRLVGMSDEAIDVLGELMQTGTADNVRLKASTEVLDRAGVRGGHEIDLNADITVTETPIKELSARLDRLAGAVSPANRAKLPMHDQDSEIIDAEIVENDDQLTLPGF